MNQDIKKDIIKHVPIRKYLNFDRESNFMNQLAKLSVCIIASSLITGCSWLWGEKGYFKDRSNEYLKAHQTPPLKIPESLKGNTLPFDTLYPIPNNIPNPTYTQYTVPRPVPLQVVADANLPSLQTRSGVQWLIVQQPVASTYQQVLQYFKQAGFQIDMTRPHTGEFSTTWVKPNALTNMLSSRLLAVDSSLVDQEIRLKVRVEPGVQTNSSEIYVLDMVRSEHNTASLDWPAASQNTLIESVLLDELSANMGSMQTNESTALLSDQYVPAKAKISLTKNDLGLPVLATPDNFDVAWTQVEYAINAADIKIDDIDRSSGLYYINLAEKANGSEQDESFFTRLFGKSSKKELDAKAERYIIQIKPVGSMTHISVLDPNLSPVAADKAEAILKQLQRALIKT